MRKPNVADSKVADEAATTALLCDKTFSTSGKLPSTIRYTESAAYDDEYIVGYSIDNVAIYNALTSVNTDALKENVRYMDQCMLSTTSTGNVIKYHTLSGCYGSKGSTTKIPDLCENVTLDLCQI